MRPSSIQFHRRLRERLVESTEWVEFETPYAMQAILGGLGNIDQCRTTGSEFFEGVSLRMAAKVGRPTGTCIFSVRPPSLK